MTDLSVKPVSSSAAAKTALYPSACFYEDEVAEQDSAELLAEYSSGGQQDLKELDARIGRLLAVAVLCLNLFARQLG